MDLLPTCIHTSSSHLLSPLQVIACAALYLACKVEEQPRSVNTVSEAMFSIAHRHKPNVLKMQSDRVSLL